MSDDNRDELEALGLNYIGSGSRPHVTDSVTNAYSDAPDDPDTIRTRLEAIQGRHGEQEQGPGWIGQMICAECAHGWPCPDYVDAVAALDLLNNAEEERIEGPPRGSGGSVTRDLLPTGRVLVPDPERYAK